jgi:hypothetical protein
MAGLPKWSALAAGLGALVGTGIGADAAAPHEVRVLVADNKVYLSEHGGAFQELALGETPESAKFCRLLNQLVPAGGVFTLPVGPTIVAEGGASGKWSPPKSETQAPRQGK